MFENKLRESQPQVYPVVSMKTSLHACAYREIYSQLFRCSTAKGSNTGLCLKGPTKVKACKFILKLFLKSNKEHLVDAVDHTLF